MQDHTPKRRIRANKNAAFYLAHAAYLLDLEAERVIARDRERLQMFAENLRAVSNSLETILRKSKRIPPQPAADGAVEVQS